MLTLAMAVLAPTSAQAAAPTLVLQKSQNHGSGPLLPGQSFSYSLQIGCSSLDNTNCPGAMITDTIPGDLVVDTPLPSSPDYTTTYDAGTRLLTVTFLNNLGGGQVGLAAGDNLAIPIQVTLPTNTTTPDGTALVNIAHASANPPIAPVDSGPATVTVSIPRTAGATGTKTLAPNTGVAQSGAATTVTLGVTNTSSSTARVDQLSSTDSSTAFWDDFDLTGFGAVTFPPGADQVQVDVCTAAPCTSFTPGTPSATPTLPAGVTNADVVGLRYTFSSSTNAPLTAGTGSVAFTAALRGTVRSTSAPLNPTVNQTVTDCATPNAHDPVAGDGTGPDACANYTIFPNTPTLSTAKTFFPDAAGTFTSNGTAIAGQGSGVSANVTVTNTSPFAVRTMTITEPSAATPTVLPNNVAVSGMRLTFPTGATTATVTETCSTAPQPAPVVVAFSATPVPLSTGCTSPATSSQIVVVFEGDDGTNGTIAANQSATLGVHGTLTNATGAGPLTNCATGAVSVTGINGPAADGCRSLTVQAPSSAVGVVKTQTSTHLVAGQPFSYTATARNNGNLPANSVVLTDPPDPTAAGNPFAVVALSSATATPAGTPIEVYDPTANAGAGGWVAYNAGDAALLDRAMGIRISPTSALAPGTSAVLTYAVTLRAGQPDGTVVHNCAQDTYLDVNTSTVATSAASCVDATVNAVEARGSVRKTTNPTSVPRPLNGVTPTPFSVILQASNTGNVPVGSLAATDVDPGFWDAVDFAGLGSVSFPPGANRVEVDACTSATACANGTFATGTPATTLALPGSVSAGSVFGLRFVYTNSGGGVVINACANPNNPSTCPSGSVSFSVTPRVAPRSAPTVPFVYPGTLADSATGTATGVPGDPTASTPLDATLATASENVTSGTNKLTTAKSFTPNAVVLGGVSTVTLSVTNTGTGAISEVDFTDAIPAGMLFTGVAPTATPPGGGSSLPVGANPYVVSYLVPAGTPAPPAPVFAEQHDTRDPSLNVSQVDFDFLGWTFLPGAQVQVQFQVTLAAGTAANTVISNTSSVTTPSDPGLTCGAGATPGPCIATAGLRSLGGDAFSAQKWVHGDDALGFYDTITNTYVTPGDPGCPSLTQAGVTYTRTPCIALVLPGQDFQFLLVVSNVGATAASRINMVDVLPVAGDTGVLLTGQQRGTQWNNAPILTAAPTVIGDSHVTAPEVAFSYTSGAQSSVCTNDLTFPPTSCPPGAWDPTFTAASTAFRAVATFPTGSHLPPGGSVIISVPLRAPVDPDSAQSLPIAWNSFAHTDFVDGSGQLLPQEPPKVGIAMPLGNLVITKQIGTPGPAGGVGPFTASYTCTVTPSGGTPVVVATGSGPFTVGAPLTVANLPASASCQVWESDAGGGVSDHPAANPATVTIPIGATITTAPDAAVTLTNTFPTTGGTGTGSGGTGTGSGGSGTGSGGSGTGSGGSHPSQPTHSGSGNVLAQTGSDIVAMLAIGALIAAAGALLCLLARRRRPS